MLILSQTKDMEGYHGTVGTPTNMYDYRGMPLFVGDVVCLTTYGDDGKSKMTMALNLFARKIQALQIGLEQTKNMLWASQILTTVQILNCSME